MPDVGKRCEAPAGAPPLAGVVERVAQDERFRAPLPRTERPFPGVVVLGSHVVGGAARGMMSYYLYGADAVAAADAVRQQMADWLAKAVEP